MFHVNLCNDLCWFFRLHLSGDAPGIGEGTEMAGKTGCPAGERYLLGRQIVDSVLTNDDGAGMRLDWERIESAVERIQADLNSCNLDKSENLQLHIHSGSWCQDAKNISATHPAPPIKSPKNTSVAMPFAKTIWKPPSNGFVIGMKLRLLSIWQPINMTLLPWNFI